MSVSDTFTLPALTDEEKDRIAIKVNEQVKPYEEMAERGMIPMDYVEQLRTEKTVEEIKRRFPETGKHAAVNSFTTEEINRQPWIKDLLNYRDARNRFHLAVKTDPEAWDKAAREAFVAKATAGTLSPIMAIVCQYLLYSNDAEFGRRSVINLFLFHDANTRLNMHNWEVLSSAPNNLEIIEGGKVASLKAPLYPYLDAQLTALNARLLSTDGLSGGSPLQLKGHTLFTDDSTVLGDTITGGSFAPIYDQEGNPVQAVTDLSDIERRLHQWSNDIASENADVKSKVDYLLRAITDLSNNYKSTRTGYATNNRYARAPRAEPPRRRIADAGPRINRTGRTYRGGEADADDFSKND